MVFCLQWGGVRIVCFIYEICNPAQKSHAPTSNTDAYIHERPRTKTSKATKRSFLAHFLLADGAFAVIGQISHRIKALITRGRL
jgi:hypothetical protein